MTGFEVLSRYLPGGTEEIREESRYDNVCPSQVSKRPHRNVMA